MKGNILVFSYNRPELIIESLDSIYSQSEKEWELTIVDDGSDYDIEKLVDSYAESLEYDEIGLLQIDKVDDDIRYTDPLRFSNNLNSIIDEVVPESDEYLTYLCDDDIFAQDWIFEATKYIDDYHVVNGIPGVLGSDIKRPLGTFDIGSFLIRTECFYDCGSIWTAGLGGEAHSYDVGYFQNILMNHKDIDIKMVDKVAMYRRFHDDALSRKGKNEIR